MNTTSMNNCPCNESKRFQCILRNTDYDCEHYLLLTEEQIRMVRFLISEDIINSDNLVFIVLDDENLKFEKV